MPETIYIKQSAAGGGDTGFDAANAHSVAWFNNSANWGVGVDKITAGDTVRIEGTITTPMVFQGGGSAGNPITLLFGTGAKFSKPVWEESGAIYMYGIGYVTIDGAATGVIGGKLGNPSLKNGIIENTDNGTNLGNQLPSNGVNTSGCHHITVKNLAIENLYVHAQGTDGGAGSGILALDGNGLGQHDLLFQNCYLHDLAVGINTDYAIASNYEFDRVTVFNCNWGGRCGDRGAGGVMDDLWVHDCYFHDWRNWDSPSENGNHHNGFYAWAESGGVINNATFSNNFLGPNFTDALSGYNASTSGIFVSGKVINVTCYNNVGINNTGPGPSNAVITFGNNYGAASTFLGYNNTFIGGNGSASLAFGVGSYGSVMTATIQNNLFEGAQIAISSLYSAGLTLISNHNLGHGLGSNAFRWGVGGSGGAIDLAAWQLATGQDADIITSNPNLLPDYTLPQGSSAIGVGANISSIFTTDITGATRTLPWDIGAYRYAVTTPGGDGGVTSSIYSDESSEQPLLVKIASSVGATVYGFECPYVLWRKIVLALGGTVTGHESELTLIAKAGRLWGANVNGAMFEQTILHKALLALGGDVSGRESIQRTLFEIANAVAVPSTPILLGSMDITDGDNMLAFTRGAPGGYTGTTGAAFAYEAAIDEPRTQHHVAGDVGFLFEETPTPCALPAPTNLSFGANGINLNVDGTWDAVIGSVGKYQFRYDGAGTIYDVVPTATATALHTTGAAGTHTVQIRAVSPSGVAGAWSAASSNVVLVGGGGGGDTTTNLVAHWPMNEGSGTTVADVTGNGHAGTVSGSGSSWSPGAVGASSINFAGAAVDVSVTRITTSSSSFTIAGWILPAVGATGRLYQGIIWDTILDHGLLLHNGKLNFYDGSDHDAGTAMAEGQWHHFAAVVNAGAGTYYLDGVADGTFTYAHPLNMMEFGAEYSNTLYGRLDDLRIYSRALASADVLALKAMRNAAITPTDVSGVRMWTKADALSLSDGDPVTSWTDLSGVGNHPTSSGAARPIFHTNVINGKPTLRGDGSVGMHLPFSITAKPVTIFFVAKCTGTTAYQSIVSLSNTSETLVGLARVVQAAGYEWCAYANGDKTSTHTLAAFHVCAAVIRDFNDMDLITDGVVVNNASGTGFYGGDANDRRGLFSTWSGGVPVEGFYGDIAEVAIFNTTPSAAEIEGLLDYLGTKYGITITH